MDDTSKHVKARRILKSLVFGILAGVVILCAYIAPTAIRNTLESSAATIRQENLIPARGEALDSFAMAEVFITVLLDGKPHDGMSIAADQGFWAVPESGEIRLSLAPNNYHFIAGFENRKSTFSYKVFEDEANAYVVDVGNAPSAPELQILDVPKRESVVIPLDFFGADTVTAANLPEGISVAKRDGKFILIIDESELSKGFTGVRLTAENQYGQAFAYIGLRKPRDKKATPIYSAEDLEKIRTDLSGHYVLMNSIDLNGIDDWKPIGAGSYPFTGIFDGGGYEITGFHAPSQIHEGTQFAFFGSLLHAEVRNIIFRKPVITPIVPERDLGTVFGCGVLAATASNSLIENCGSFGGIVNPSSGLSGGLFADAFDSVVLSCFNSTDVICGSENRYLPNTGGIIGGAQRCYVAYCVNEGEIKGNHLSGGIVGWANVTNITRCVNSGYIWGSTIVGAVPVGGIVQSNDSGAVYNSYFVRGLSPIGAHSSNGIIAAVIPIDGTGLRMQEKLALIGSFAEESPEWTYASLDTQGPVPFGIFKMQTSAPQIKQAGNNIEILPVEGAQYFYSLDGSDPKISCTEPTDHIRTTLKQGQELTVFAAKQGYRDSKVVTAKGGY